MPKNIPTDPPNVHLDSLSDLQGMLDLLREVGVLPGRGFPIAHVAH